MLENQDSVSRIVLAALAALVLLATAPCEAALSIARQSGSLTFPGVTLTAVDQVVSGNAAPTWRVDARGTTTGWNVTLQISDFTAAGGKLIGAANVSYTALNGSITRFGRSSQKVDPTNGPGETGVTGTLDTARKAVTTNAGFGDGRYDWTADATQFQLMVPATALTGSYTATLTATVNSGP